MSVYDSYGQREFDTSTESSLGPHIVTHPTRGPHVEPRAGSVILLLMDTLVAHRLGRRLVLYELLAPVRVCGDCQAAYELARSVVENAGGVQAWAQQVSRREALDGDLALDVLCRQGRGQRVRWRGDQNYHDATALMALAAGAQAGCQ